MFAQAATLLLIGSNPSDADTVNMTRAVGMVFSTADALDALRESVKGCGKEDAELWIDTCGVDVLCSDCRAKARKATAQLLGISESEVHLYV